MPLVGVTIGDPAGIGPEIVARAVTSAEVRTEARIAVLGTASILEKALHLVGSDLGIRRISSALEAEPRPDQVDVVDIPIAEAERIVPGVVQGGAGRASFEYVRSAIEAATRREIAAIATAPINKEALRAGGVPYLDHTEMLGKLTGSPEPLTLFVVGNLRIFFLTRHVPLMEACRLITTANVLRGIQAAHSSLRRLAVERPRIAVAGLNPHAGDGGLFGQEDSQQIAPAVSAARRLGIEVFGPIPADSVFFLTLRGEYDAVLSLYHDQGHIAAKTLDFERTVSVTLGLPFIRTSVDHGTAFDIAWSGKASSVGMEEAIKVAARYARLSRSAG